MKVRNVHERTFDAPASRVGGLIDSLSSESDRLWPHGTWPAMRFDGPLAIGAKGGHGPVRYVIEAYEPGKRVVFRFTGPRGFHGTHGYGLERKGAGHVVLRHELEMETAGLALLTWPFFFGPLHNAVVEDSLDKAELELLGRVEAERKWSPYVRLLRWAALTLRRRKRARAAQEGTIHVPDYGPNRRLK